MAQNQLCLFKPCKEGKDRTFHKHKSQTIEARDTEQTKRRETAINDVTV